MSQFRNRPTVMAFACFRRMRQHPEHPVHGRTRYPGFSQIYILEIRAAPPALYTRSSSGEWPDTGARSIEFRDSTRIREPSFHVAVWYTSRTSGSFDAESALFHEPKGMAGYFRLGDHRFP